MLYAQERSVRRRKSRSAIVVVSALAWLASGPSPAAAGGPIFGPFDVLNDNAASDSGEDLSVRLATDGAGNWVAVWRSTDDLGGTIDNDSDILTARSDDDGASWTTPIALNSNAAVDSITVEDRAPAIATDGAGTWIAVWQSNAQVGGIGPDDDILYAVSTDNGAMWTFPAALNTNATTDSNDDEAPEIATDGTAWVVVWQSTDTLGGTVDVDHDIFVSASLDDGGSWSAVAALNTNADSDLGSDTAPTVGTDGSGTWLAAWESSEDMGGAGTDFDIFFALSASSGASWTAPAILNSNATLSAANGGNNRDVDLATDGAGNWVAAWRSTGRLGGGADNIGTDSDIVRATSNDNGASWGMAEALNTSAFTDSGEDRRPSVGTDGQGRWLAAWESNDDLGQSLDSDYDVLLARSGDAGASWSDPELAHSNAATDAGDDMAPDVTSNGAQTWLVAWDSTDTLLGTIDVDLDLLFIKTTGGCSPTPLAMCRQPTIPGKGAFVMVDKTPNDKDKVKFKWVRGDETFTADFGMPDVDTSYVLCTYDASSGSDTLVHGTIAPAGDLCTGLPCWRPTSTKGWRYKDKDKTPCGVSKARLREGVQGKSKIQFFADGPLLATPSLPLVLPVRVQLQASNGECWEASYSSFVISDSTKFRAKPD